MNEHARNIWQAWLDGEKLEYYHSFFWKWEEAQPCDPDVSYPHHKSNCWRIKPKTNTRYYRVYLMEDTNEVRVIEILNKEDKLDAEEFIRDEAIHFRWLTDWVSYEVEDIKNRQEENK